jgi:hypothetical protein
MKTAKMMMMMFISLLVFACNRDIHPIETKPFSQKNPTDYEFALPVSEVRKKLLAAFKDFDLRQKLASSFDSNSRYLVSVRSKDDPDPEKTFDNPENKNDLYLHSWGEIIGPSPIYFGGGKPLEYRAEFQLHLTKAGNNRTKVSVITHKPHVINGSKCCGPHGEVSNNVPVEPTTIEEYKILLFIGSVLGTKDMPPLRMPEGV